MKIIKGNKTTFTIRPYTPVRRRLGRRQKVIMLGYVMIAAGCAFVFFALLSLRVYDPAMLAPWLFISIQNSYSAWLVK